MTGTYQDYRWGSPCAPAAIIKSAIIIVTALNIVPNQQLLTGEQALTKLGKPESAQPRQRAAAPRDLPDK